MFIHEALSKSLYVTHPNINGIVMAQTGEWGDSFTRIYISEAHGKFSSSPYELSYSCVISGDWTPVTFTVTSEEIKD